MVLEKKENNIKQYFWLIKCIWTIRSILNRKCSLFFIVFFKVEFLFIKYCLREKIEGTIVFTIYYWKKEVIR